MDALTRRLHDHYRAKFLAHGATSEGVDWGANEEFSIIRQDAMLEVAKQYVPGGTLLDVGCGYGALADRINERGLNISYTGIDIVEEMVDEARRRHPHLSFIHGDFLSISPAVMGTFDYVICNGILTQKLEATTLEMNAYAQRLIAALFSTCRSACAFNTMSTYVNYQATNLYYRNPSELLAWCMSELTPRVRLDHAYPLWEYTLYLHREGGRLGPGGMRG